MKRSVVRLIFLALVTLSAPAFAQTTLLHDVRMSASDVRTRLVFDLSTDTQPDIFMVADPLRLVIDLPHTRKVEHMGAPLRGGGLLKDIRTGVHQGSKIRVVLDLAEPVHARSFMLSPVTGHKYRLVLDLYPENTSDAEIRMAENDAAGDDGPPDNADAGLAGNERSAKEAVALASAETDSKAVKAGNTESKPPVGSKHADSAGQVAGEFGAAGQKAQKIAKSSTAKSADRNAERAQNTPKSRHVAASRIAERSKTPKQPARDVIIAIDPGHGGRDPGAIGPGGTEEKTVTLAIARALKQMVDDQPHMKAVLTRNSDTYVDLRQRMINARNAKADFFVSIHNDASPGAGRARGASVYALSNNGATSEHARWLEHRENAADMVGGTHLPGTSERLADFVLDLSQGASIAASKDAGRRVLAQLGTIGALHRSTVQQAAFVVLKSPDIPSILVETNYITNPVIERKLVTSTYQKKLAAVILRGIKGYFAGYRPSTYITAEQRHRVRRGDTLSQIAQVYGVSVQALKHANHLDDNMIRVGSMLKIPGPEMQQIASRD